jgi:hypothetical protein
MWEQASRDVGHTATVAGKRPIPNNAPINNYHTTMGGLKFRVILCNFTRSDPYVKELNCAHDLASARAQFKRAC